MTLRLLDLFSGIGGFSLGLERTGGFKTVAFCEIDPFCRRVLAKHWPDVPCHDDITTREFYQGEADVITGGFPCQDVSLAGNRAGLSGARSGLYRELVRAIRVVRPRHAIVENVAALLGDGMGAVLGDLAESGVDTEWDCVPASAIGAPHQRDRVWIVAHTAGLPGGQRHEPASERGRSDEAEQAGLGIGGSLHAADPGGDGRCPSAQGREPPGCTIPDEDGKREGCATGWQVEQSRAAGFADPDPASGGCRQGWSRRPADSFARVRDEARRNAADPYGARLAFREGVSRDAWEERPAIERNRLDDERQSVWPDEPALSGVDDGIPDWLDRVRATGNTVVPQIPELIGRAILASIAAQAA